MPAKAHEKLVASGNRQTNIYLAPATDTARRSPALVWLSFAALALAVFAALVFGRLVSPQISANTSVICASVPLQEVLTRGKALQSQSGPFSALSLYEEAAANLSATGCGSTWPAVDRATLLEAVAELYTATKQATLGIEPRLQAIELRRKAAKPTPSDLLLAHVALIDHYFAAMRYADALATLRRARDQLGAAATAVTSAALTRVEASVRDCQRPAFLGR
eukprot:TRINITY_DN9294_c0_g2_i1.p1 TRINITY_DN9294_c0_g2~~TRINITY_DN9294_c0_g2_i1.p1  ORF type:complete len:221 (+),score=44.17 TRINITY_DN9294_c0_g2_i1:653-1315(+)